MNEKDTAIDTAPIVTSTQSKISGEDLIFWVRLPGWKVKEQAALLLGLNPDCHDDYKYSKQFTRYRLMMKRAKRARHLSDRASPQSVLSWAKSNRIPVPSDLKAAVSQSAKLINWRKKYFDLKKSKTGNKRLWSEDDYINPKIKDSLETMILLMALAKFDFNASESRGKAAKAIHELTKKYDDKLISYEAILDRLRAAAAEQKGRFQISGKSIIP